MYATLYFLSAFLATTTLALPAATNPGFRLSALKIHEVEGGNTTIRFSIFDPDPLTNGTGICRGEWLTGSGGYPTGSYESCGNTTFAWNMNSYDNITSFVLGLEHLFTDPSYVTNLLRSGLALHSFNVLTVSRVGDYPYDQVITFGNAVVNQPDIMCTAHGHAAECCQDTNSTIRAPIYATTSKRR
ncbi:hypothetical protein LTR62_005802 [Meristemomyces frigidus]|uniref:Uncharacterized protein n=1 Tax=Meristemomyces frigidus TaxID=1508187 RepID=A0AAN7YF04_9PEZI|nr:hypothetical protein LTR62_005802 [Meristemomyces frigidus]